MAVVYLLHFDAPYPNDRRPRHYIGVAADLDSRIGEHRAGSLKCRLTRALREHGIGFVVARTWDVGPLAKDAFDKERELKRRRQHSDHCPLCKENEK